MRTSTRTALAGLAAFALIMGPAGAADDPCTDPDTGELVLEEQQVYLHQAETKVGNLGATGGTGFPTWDDEAPTQSVTEGAGGGYLTPYSQNEGVEAVDFTVVGDVSGCLDTMLLDLYAFLPTNRTGTAGTLDERAFSGYFDLFLNDVRILWGPEVETNTVPNPDGDATYLIRLAITGIDEAMALEGLDNGGEYEVRLRVTPRFVNTNNAIFVYDTTEVPAGIQFNGIPDDDYALVTAG